MNDLENPRMIESRVQTIVENEQNGVRQSQKPENGRTIATCLAIVRNMEEFALASQHPYRNHEFFMVDLHEIYEVPDDEAELMAFLSVFEQDGIRYWVNWEQKDLVSVNGVKIPPVYDVC